MPAGYWPRPSERGDVVDSLVLTSELNCFLAGDREFNLRVQERRRAGRVGVGPCVGGGLAGRGSGRWRLEETHAAHRAASLGATTIVSCGSSHRRLSAQDKHICYPFPLKRQRRQSKGRISNTCRTEGTRGLSGEQGRHSVRSGESRAEGLPPKLTRTWKAAGRKTLLPLQLTDVGPDEDGRSKSR